MSIKPEYVSKIFSGEKNYELRKKVFKKDIKTIVVYASRPIMKVVGEFDVGDIIKDTPVNIFNRFKDEICIKEDKFFEYFYNADIAYAIKIGAFCKYASPIELSFFGVKKAPQSYVYIK